MAELGIHTGGDLRQQTRDFLTARFGMAGDYYYAAARGEDDRPVVADQQRKSIGAETTFERDLLVWEEVPLALAPVLVKVWAGHSKAGLAGRTVTVKVKYEDFRQITRSRSYPDVITSQAIIEQLSFDLLRPLFPPPLAVRLLGVTVSNFADAASLARQQLTFVLK